MRYALITAVVGGLACAAAGQSLLERPTERVAEEGVELPEQAAADGKPTPSAVSLFAVDPPPPRTFQENDLVTIIVSERTKIDRSQTLETNKEYDIDGGVTSFIDVLTLLEGRVEENERDNYGSVEVGFGNDFQGEGTYERDDTVTARVTARVVEVKPNGTLLLESRSRIKTDEEEQTIVISGLCRQEDITLQNTVQSNQLYDAQVSIEHAGEVRNGGKKGLIPRALEALFNF